MERDLRFIGADYDRDEVRQTLFDLEGALATIGGMFIVSSVREEIDGEWVTTGIAFKYDSYSPAARPVLHEVEPEDEAVAA